MKGVVKKVIYVIVACLLLLGINIGARYIFDGTRGTRNKTGTAADVGKYDAASERVERAAGAISDAAENVRGAHREVRISINEIGNIGNVARDIGDGINRTLDGTSDIADGIQRVMGILYEAEKRNAEMETASNNRMD